MKILAISDQVIDLLYSAQCRPRFEDVDFVLSCGDLPYYYVEFVLNALDKPLFFVRGNHASRTEYSRTGDRSGPRGAVDLHRRVVRHHDLILAGIEGSVRYNSGDFQYTQAEMWSHVIYLLPQLLFNRLAYGRYLDVFVTHAPSRGIHDKPDPAHIGANAFHWLVRTMKPAYHFHGHIHRYHYSDPAETKFGDTLVVNAYGYRVVPILSQAEAIAEAEGKLST